MNTNNTEFIVNEYITLRLEGKNTVIYIKDQRFRHCKYLLINVTPQNIGEFEDIKSIDDAAQLLDHSLDNPRINNIEIPPETEFWGHSSNLQTWAENNYDVNLLHSNLVLPLLKKLTQAGDDIARVKFKEEIAKKFSNCNVVYIFISIRDKDLDFFEKEERALLIEELFERNKECYWFFLPFLIDAGYLKLNSEELEDLVVKSYRRVHRGVFNSIDVYGELVKNFFNIILKFEKKLDE